MKILLFLLSFLTIRSKRKWLFGSNMGFSSNVKYFFLECVNNTEFRAIWIGKDAEQVSLVRSLGFESYKRWSLRGFYHGLTSRVYIYNSNIYDINLSTLGSAYRVNLWHGVGIKNIERKIRFGKINRIFNTKNPFLKIRKIYLFLKPNLFLSTSEMMTDHFSECFGITKDKCIEAMYPRCTLFSFSRDKLNEHIDKYDKDLKDIIFKIKYSEYLYIYMPTWRDNGADIFTYSGIDLDILDNSLRGQNNFMIIKLHPSCKINFAIDKFSNIIFMNSQSDIYPLLPFSDCLITDYSSILYDYILMDNKDVILYVPDYEQYISQSRDFAYPFDENVCGTIIKDFNTLIDRIEHKELYTDNKDYRDKINVVRDKFWSSDLDSSDDIINRIKKEIKL